MPYFPPEVKYVVGVYERCRENRCLPRAGGLLDQPAWLMECFAVIDAVKADKARQDRERAEREDAVRRR